MRVCRQVCTTYQHLAAAPQQACSLRKGAEQFCAFTSPPPKLHQTKTLPEIPNTKSVQIHLQRARACSPCIAAARAFCTAGKRAAAGAAAGMGPQAPGMLCWMRRVAALLAAG